jgi:hypothetical protein
VGIETKRDVVDGLGEEWVETEQQAQVEKV